MDGMKKGMRREREDQRGIRRKKNGVNERRTKGMRDEEG